MIPVGLVDLSKNRVARWGAAVAVAVVCLALAHCQGVRSGRADSKLHAADSAAAGYKRAGDDIHKANAAHDAALRDSEVANAKRSAQLDSAIAKANAAANKLSSVGPVPAPIGTITVVHRDSSGSSAPRPGLGAADDPPDSVKYAGIQRQGDPRLYVVPQFAVDVYQELRGALTKAVAQKASSDSLYAQATRLLASTKDELHDRNDQIGQLQSAEHIAKSQAGRDCTLLPFVPCLPRWLTFTIGAAGGGFVGYKIGETIAHK